MATSNILALLQQEARGLETRLNGIRGAIAALTGAPPASGSFSSGIKRGPGRPPKMAAPKRRRKVSAAQKKAQSLKMKAYWAKKKAAARK